MMKCLENGRSKSSYIFNMQLVGESSVVSEPLRFRANSCAANETHGGGGVDGADPIKGSCARTRWHDCWSDGERTPNLRRSS